MLKEAGRVLFAALVVGALASPSFAEDKKEEKKTEAAAGEFMPRADNIKKFKVCKKEAGKDKAKKGACKATRLANRKIRLAKIDEWKTKWRGFKKAKNAAMKSCKKDKEGKRKAKDAWKTASKWWSAMHKWVRKGGTKPEGDWPSDVPACAAAEKKEEKKEEKKQ
jgi:hypothetical protein